VCYLLFPPDEDLLEDDLPDILPEELLEGEEERYVELLLVGVDDLLYELELLLLDELKLLL